ncbi:hypothetical protein Nepgr_033917 [Nepenthes gracilis]|uniref:Exocyst complex subunit Exo70 C-terminal domain-containing protein n=1 Tax=Nepenthes gracilis TaxID=150966 RepID=A0AAD3TLI3_NEPGR|nr:hypothetical protein Nepgr_033917 [Nepenthes gracilis]
MEPWMQTEVKAKSYKDPSLQYIFMMNNGGYIEDQRINGDSRVIGGQLKEEAVVGVKRLPQELPRRETGVRRCNVRAKGLQ